MFQFSVSLIFDSGIYRRSAVEKYEQTEGPVCFSLEEAWTSFYLTIDALLLRIMQRELSGEEKRDAVTVERSLVSRTGIKSAKIQCFSWQPIDS